MCRIGTSGSDSDKPELTELAEGVRDGLWNWVYLSFAVLTEEDLLSVRSFNTEHRPESKKVLAHLRDE